MYLSEIAKSICPNWKMHLSEITKWICPNFLIYLSKFENVLSQPLRSEAWIASQARKFGNWANIFQTLKFPRSNSFNVGKIFFRIFRFFKCRNKIPGQESHLVLWLWKCKAEKIRQGNCERRTQEFHSPLCCND